jgi:hypothetical protein
MFRAGDVDSQRKTCRDRGVFYIQHGHSCSAVPGPRLRKGGPGVEVSFCGGPAKPERDGISTLAAVAKNSLSA